MNIESAYDEFIKKCQLLIHTIEVSLPSKQGWEKENSERALKNAKKWLQLAIDGDLYHKHRRNFGLSKSDLMFGEFEDRLYELERFYSKNIYDAHGKQEI